jgi:predicted HD superfamily hydrolase involved in NAD metabolism
MTLSYDDALSALRDRLGEGSVAHSERVAHTAAALAAVYGADEAAARLAGLLHDWDRECDGEDLIESARNLGVSVTEADAAHPYILHARTGARDVAASFPELPVAVVNAIARHTIGAREMTILDKVVYLADMLEPSRTFEGADDLRALIGEVSIDELFALSYQQSVRYLVDSRRRIHPDTVEAWNAHVARDSR